METSIQFHGFESFFFAVPIIIVSLVLPAVLIYIVFVRTRYKVWKKIALVPFCFVGPTIASLPWPFLLKICGIIGVTGGDGSVSYTAVATELFADYSEYVWVGITSIAVFLIYRLSGKRTA